MGIAFNCSCGKRISVSDVLAGRTIKCPNCHNGVVVPASSPPVAGKTAGKKPVVEKEVETVIHISMGKVMAAVALFVVVVCAVMIAIGPWHVWNQWEAIGPTASDQVTDVITFALQAQMSEIGFYDPSDSHMSPALDGGPQFLRPVAVMNMPEFVHFRGKSNQGDYEGDYDTITGEIEADVHYGGYSVAGQVDVKKATGEFHITGREIDGKPEAEVDGKNLEVIRSKPKSTTPLLF